MFTVKLTLENLDNGAVFFDCSTVINGGLFGFEITDIDTVAELLEGMTATDQLDVCNGGQAVISYVTHNGVRSGLDDIVYNADLTPLFD